MSSESRAEALAEQLRTIEEALSDYAIELLVSARRGETLAPALIGLERRVTRARRAVEKAIGLLCSPDSGADE